MNDPRPAPWVHWLLCLLPALAVAIEIGLRAFGAHATYQRFYEAGEASVNEIATVVVLVIAVVAAIRALYEPMTRLRRGWVVLLLLGCVYFAGEEASWGQHWIGWSTPETWQAINDQGETNLHNISGWLDQKPRLLLELWVLVGLIVLLRNAFAATPKLPIRPWLWPTATCAVAGTLAIMVRVPERLGSAFDVDLGPLWTIRLAETQELMFAFFLLAFVVTLRRD